MEIFEIVNPEVFKLFTVNMMSEIFWVGLKFLTESSLLTRCITVPPNKSRCRYSFLIQYKFISLPSGESIRITCDHQKTLKEINLPDIATELNSEVFWS
jgi:hypothetical protein